MINVNSNEAVENQQFEWLDLMRGISALVVVFCHLRLLTFETYAEAKNLNIFGKVFYFFSSQFGSMAVIVFFTLSGFFIVRSIDKAIIKNAWKWSEYLLSRLTRLYVVLVPALLITLIFDMAGNYWVPQTPFYLGELTQEVSLSRLDIPHFFGSLFFLQFIVIMPFGSNGPLWSLSYEFWYYMIWPLLVTIVIYKPIKVRILNFFLLSIIVAFLLFFNTNVVLYFVIWSMGGFSYFLYKGKYAYYFKMPVIRWLSVFLLIFSFIFTRFQVVPVVYTDFLIGIFSSSVILVLAQLNFPEKISGLSRFLSNISYTLYLVHFPFLAFVTSYFSYYDLSFSFSSLLIFGGLFALTLLFAYLVWFMFEKRTSGIKLFLSNYLK